MSPRRHKIISIGEVDLNHGGRLEEVSGCSVSPWAPVTHPLQDIQLVPGDYLIGYSCIIDG